GDPVLTLIAQAQADVDEASVRSIIAQYNLDQPVYRQYLIWAGTLLTGDLGRSIVNNQPVADVLSSRLLPTLQIGLTAWVLTMLISIPVGAFTAAGKNTWKDWLGTSLSLVGAAMPYFLTAGLLIYVVALHLKWLPVSGYVSLFADPLQSIKTTILPALALVLWLTANVTRQARSSFIEVLQLPYIRTARAKGLTEGQVMIGHAFKNAMLPIVTVLGLQLAQLVSGTVIIETVFAVPGLGRLIVDAILARDYTVAQGVVLFFAFSILLINLLVDLAYGLFDPRVRKA
ncbi:MAG: ABC transporter permease, partial [Pseudorhodoplanes sp.]